MTAQTTAARMNKIAECLVLVLLLATICVVGDEVLRPEDGDDMMNVVDAGVELASALVVSGVGCGFTDTGTTSVTGITAIVIIMLPFMSVVEITVVISVVIVVGFRLIVVVVF